MIRSITTYGRVAFDGIELQEVVYPEDCRQPRHAHPELSISLLLAGGMTERIPGRPECRAATLAVGVKPPGTEHANQYAPAGARILSLKLSEPWWASHDGQFAQRVWGWAPAGPALRPWVRLLQRFRSTPEDASRWLEPLVVDVLSEVDADARIADVGDPPGYLLRVREQLLDTYDRGVQARAIAAQVGIDPATLARAFRRYFRESMSECVRRRRMQAAASLLRRPDVPLGEIAARIGLADQSHLTRLCRQECGHPPAAFRRVLTGQDRSRRALPGRHRLGQ